MAYSLLLSFRVDSEIYLVLMISLVVMFFVIRIISGAMRGEERGCASLIQGTHPKATFFWCASHQLNRVLVNSFQKCSDIANMMGNLDKVNYLKTSMYVRGVVLLVVLAQMFLLMADYKHQITFPF